MSNLLFSKEDYSSNNGMITSIWGPGMWHFLHTISFNYPNKPTKEDKAHYKQYIDSLQHVLPCKYCRENYGNNLKNAGYKAGVFKNRDTFSRFVYRLHNEVNKQLDKPTCLTYEEVRDRYENYRSRCLSADEIAKMIQRKKERGCVHPIHGESRRAIIIIKKKSDCRGMKSSIQDSCKSKSSSKKRKSKSRKDRK